MGSLVRTIYRSYGEFDYERLWSSLRKKSVRVRDQIREMSARCASLAGEAGSRYTIFSLRHPPMTPCDADVVTISCSVRLSAIPSVTILTIGGNRSSS